MPAPPAATVEPLGDSCLVLRFGAGAEVDLAARIRTAAARIAAAPPAGLLDLLPTFTTLALFFEPARTAADTLAAAALERLAEGGGPIDPAPPRVVEIPVAYGGDAGPDLAAVAAAAGLDADTVVRLHFRTAHVVGMIGFAPGFPYLLGLPQALRLPRRGTPRTSVPAGSVAIAEGQTGIYPRESPGGWHLIGRTTLSLFDPHRDPPALLRAGDRVRFVPIDTAAHAPGEAGPANSSLAPDGPAPQATIEVRTSGVATTVEDAGRAGWRAAGVPVGGAADDESLRTANLLVGNPDGAAAIEFAFQGPSLAFSSGTWIALAGTEFAASVSPVGGEPAPVPPRRPVWIPPGATLDIGTAATCSPGERPKGIRGCLAVAGGIDVPAVLGSRSTCLRAGFGGHRGRPLTRGDRLPLGQGSLAPPADPGRVVVSRRSVADPAADARASTDGCVTLRVVEGPEWERFPAAARERLLVAAFGVSHASDRTGLRLEGPALAGGPGGILSEALVPGTVQVPPDGAPIVVGVDAPVTGGYARIAVVATVDLPRLGQLGPGDRVRFTLIDVAHARRLAGTLARERSRRRLGWECVR